jgi:glycine oxidase
LAGAEFTAAAGVRYGLPDALPLVGASSTPGVFLALGARRNGWLLAPLIAEALLEAISGDEAGAFAPRRFVSSA